MHDLYCHIWLNFPEDDHHYFYILLFTIAILVTLNISKKILIYIYFERKSKFIYFHFYDIKNLNFLLKI